MTEFEQAIADWRDFLGESKFIKKVTEASIDSYGPVVEFINKARFTKYYTAFEDTDNTIERKEDGTIRTVRSLNHTARSRQRKSYVRASQWGGNKSESVIGTKAGEMSMKTINEVTSSFMDGRLMVIKVTEGETLMEGAFDDKFEYETNAILSHFGVGHLPGNIKKIMSAADSNFWSMLSNGARADGF